jgi:anti-sigma B factor antagonist
MDMTEQGWTHEQLADGAWAVSGQIDFSVSATFRAFMRALVAGARSDLRFDLGRLSYLDSSGLAVLLEARRLLAARDLKLTVTAVTPQVGKLFALTQVGPLFGLAGEGE